MRKKKYLLLNSLLIIILTMSCYIFFYALPEYKIIQQNRLDEIAKSLTLESKLVLLEEIYRNVIYIENSQKLFTFKIATNRLLFSVDYQLRAGIDLNKDFFLVNLGKNSLLVRYSEPEIFSINGIDETIKLYNNWSLLGTSIKQSDFLPAIIAEYDHVAKKASLNNYQMMVNNNARAFFTTFFTSLGYQKIKFEVIKG